MFLHLPNDIIYHIFDFLPFSSLRLLNTTINNNYTKSKVNSILISKANIIKLYFKLKQRQLVLFQDLNYLLNNAYFSLLEDNVSLGLNYNGKCILYSPVEQYGNCRFCDRQLSYHKYDKMIKLYLTLGNY